MKTNFGALPKDMAARWAKIMEQDAEKVEAFARKMQEARSKSLESQLERYEAAMSGYIPEPEPEQAMIKFRRPVPFIK